MILISYTNDSKKTAIKLTNKLESFGHKCWIEPRDVAANTNKRRSIHEAIKEAELMILIFSANSDKADDTIQQYDWAFDEELPIIPFVVSDVNISVSMQHFLNTHDWINAYDTPFDTAAEDLLDYLEGAPEQEEQEEPENIERPVRRRPPPPKKTADKSQQQKYIIIGVVVVFVLILFGILFSDNIKSIFGSSTKTNTTEEKIIGTWRLIDYQDNLKREGKDLVDLPKQVENLRRNFLMVFKEDKTFERNGFVPRTEFGEWKIDEKKMVLYIIPLNEKGEDALAIQELNENTMILVIASKTDKGQIITKLTLQRQ